MSHNPHITDAMVETFKFMQNIMEDGVPIYRDDAEKLYNLSKWFTASCLDNWREVKADFHQEIRELKASVTPYHIWGKEVSDIAEIVRSDKSNDEKLVAMREVEARVRLVD